ncbi:ABC transporter ATP-binding protein [Sporosarcina limicola]|uniref:ATP-binding cassette subfamily B protein AbcA/BmrA n=1 Tax=Sporosarcina limicola TaxID=34101 RepID=A0A927MHT9_9BACL|nr:ABC transporter ATP-binding protein [Sporosarcina limicola]MBE1553287.1 ATP-binding cassette subfamily B protein AbcA/BmrA [Sporosarcina limicola]
MEVAESLKSGRPIRDFLVLLRSLEWPVVITVIAIILAIVQTAIGLIIPLITKNIIDTMTMDFFNWEISFILILIFISQAVAAGGSYYLLSYIGESIVANLRKRIWRKILKLPITYYDEIETGETMSRITQDTSTLKFLISFHLVTFFSSILSVTGSITILLFIDWKMTLIMLVSVPLCMVVIIPLGRIMYRVARSTQEEMSKFSGLQGRVLSEIRLVKTYRAEDSESGNGDRVIHQLFRYGMKDAKIQAIVSPITTLIMMGIFIVILGYGGIQVASGSLSAGALIAIIFYLFQIMLPSSQMASFFTSFQRAVGATERIQQILTMDSERDEGQSINQEGNIRFENVGFSYDKKGEVISDLSFEVPNGTVTAFVGPSGGGKTTLFSLLERFYTPSNGRILFNEKDIQTLSLSEWRGRIGYVSQESPLMSGTILDNMAYGLKKIPSMDRISKAAEDANALDFIKELPNQFDTLVGERGIKLSGGQRQRIAIARALLHNPQILLLDEATSNLDSGSEMHVQTALQRLMFGRTTLIIAHRLATVTHVDKIIFLEEGRITGIGSHEELIRTHELYRKFSSGQGLNLINC